MACGVKVNALETFKVFHLRSEAADSVERLQGRLVHKKTPTP